MEILVLTLLAALAAAMSLIAFFVRLLRRRQFSLSDLLVVMVLFAVLLLPLSVVGYRLSKVPRSVNLSFQGESCWTTPPLAGAEYWINLFYDRNKPGRVHDTLSLRLFDDTTNTLVLTTKRKVATMHLFSGDIEGMRLSDFHAVEGHRYRIEVDADQANELARYHNARLEIRVTAAEASRRAGLPL